MKKKVTFAVFVAMLCFIFSAIIGYAPSVSAAGLVNSGSTLGDLIQGVLGIFDNLVPLLIGAAVIVFLWGVLVFIAKTSSGDADGRKEGINFMIYGIIGIAVMVSVWGLVAFVTNTFGTSSSTVPQFNTSSGSITI